MLFAISPSRFLDHNCDFEVRFTRSEKRKISAMVFVRNTDSMMQTYETFVGSLSVNDAIGACGLPDDFLAKIREGDKDITRVYRLSLPLSWANRKKYRLKYDHDEDKAIVMITEFKHAAFLCEAAAKRELEYYGSFSIVNLKCGEVMQIDGKYMIFDGNTIRMAFDCEFEGMKFVDCSSVLHKSAFTSVPVSLF